MFKHLFFVLIVICLVSFTISGCGEKAEVALSPLGKGINLSALEDGEKSDSYLDKEKTYKNIAKSGFDHIRLPVDFRNYSDGGGELDEKFLSRLEAIIKMANAEGLTVILDFHGWYNLNVGNGDDELFISIWKNLAESFKNIDSGIVFELINEPHTTEGGDLDAETLMELQCKTIEEIRRISPERTVIIALAEWNGPWMLKDFEMPDYDNIIVALHTYEPLEFTHQGQKWAGTDDVHMPLTEDMLEGLTGQLELIADYKKQSGNEVILSEFGVVTNGAISESDVEKYLSCITSFAEKNDIPWTYWEYNGSFGAYKEGFWGMRSGWQENVLNALIKAEE